MSNVKNDSSLHCRAVTNLISVICEIFCFCFLFSETDRKFELTSTSCLINNTRKNRTRAKQQRFTQSDFPSVFLFKSNHVTYFFVISGGQECKKFTKAS